MTETIAQCEHQRPVGNTWLHRATECHDRVDKSARSADMKKGRVAPDSDNKTWIW